MTDRSTLYQLVVTEHEGIEPKGWKFCLGRMAPHASSAVGWVVPVEPADILLVDRKEYGPGFVGARVVSGDSLFVDMDHELATGLPPGRYAIVRLDDE